VNTLGVTSIVDAHLHVWPEKRPERPYPWTPDPHLVEDVLPVLERNGVDHALQVTPTIMGFDNAYGLQVADAYPGRFGVFGRFDHQAPDVAGNLARWMLHPGAQGIRLTFFGPTATPGALLALTSLWEACEQQSVPVAVLAPDNLDELAHIGATRPRLRLIVDHLGLGVYEGSVNPYAGWRHLPQIAATTNACVKISTLVETSVEPFPFRDVHDRLAEALELFGAHRLIWGSNYPVVLSKCGYEESLSFLAACDFLDGDQLEQLTHTTITRFLSHGTPPASADHSAST
jgi:predicted TIM-barrel fold metal-dependent hydrolase